MAQDDQKDLVRKQRIQLVRELKLRDNYQRAHTATGVWRRKDLTGEVVDEPAGFKTAMNMRSLANLSKSRA